MVSSDLPKTMRKLCLSTKFRYQEIRWNYGIFRSEYYFKYWWSIRRVKKFEKLLPMLADVFVYFVEQCKFKTRNFTRNCPILSPEILKLGENIGNTELKNLVNTEWKVSAFGVFLVRIFLYSDWIRRDTLYLSVFSPNARKYGPEKLLIQTLFTQCKLYICIVCILFYLPKA